MAFKNIFVLFSTILSGALTLCMLPASEAQLDGHPTENQEVQALIPAGSATFFRGD